MNVRTNKANAYWDQQSEPLFVARWATVVSRIFPGQVQTVKVMGAQVADGRLDEGSTALWFGNHGDESKKPKTNVVTSILAIQVWYYRAVVMMSIWDLRTNSIDCASNRQQGLQCRIAKWTKRSNIE